MDEKRVRIINSQAALKSIRDLGISLIQGTEELVDNSVDAGSERIRAHITQLDNGNLRVIIADDGCGMPEEVEGEPGRGAVQHALRFGGRMPLPTPKQPIGRFGYGLSQTATCLTTRTLVHSLCEGGKWRSCYLDIEELQRDKASLPVENPDDPPSENIIPPGWVLPSSGTIVSLHEIDRSDYDDPELFVMDLKRELGRVHRYAIDAGLEISVSLEDGEPEVLQARDPILQMPKSVEARKFGVIDEDDVAEVTIVFDGDDFPVISPVIDPETGEPARVTIRMVNADVRILREKVGLGDFASGALTRRLKPFGFTRNDQGFYLVRANREVGAGETLGVYSKRSNLNYFHAEIRFPSCLDRWFGIEVNKSEFHLDGRLKDKIAQKSASVIYQMERQTRARTSKQKAKIEARKQSNIERRSAKLRKVAPRTPRPKKQVEELQKRLEERKEEVIESVDKEADDKVSEAKSGLSEAELTQDEGAIEEGRLKVKETQEQAKKEKGAIRDRFAHDAFFRKHLRALPSDDIYAIEDFHDEIWVTINTNSRFFREVYERATSHPEMLSLLDLMVFSIAYSEANRYNSPHMIAFWKEVRRLVSRFSAIFVGTVQYEGSTSSERSTFQTREELVSGISEAAGIDPPRDLKSTETPAEWFHRIGDSLGLPRSRSVRDTVEQILATAGIDLGPDLINPEGSYITIEGMAAIEEAVLAARSEVAA